MNPWGLLVLGAGIVVIIIGVRGSGPAVASAFKAQPGQPAATAAGSGVNLPAAPAGIPSFLAPPPQFP